MSHIAPRWCALVLLAGLASMCACGGQPAEDPAAPGGAAPASAVAATSSTRRPIAEGTCDNPRIRVQVLEITRPDREALLVTFLLVNPDAAAPVTVGDRFSDPAAAAGSLSGVFVLDEGLGKRAYVMRDAQDRPMCSNGLGVIPPGGRVPAWSRFPAPAAGARQVTVQVPGVAAFRNLPITGVPPDAREWPGRGDEAARGGAGPGGTGRDGASY